MITWAFWLFVHNVCNPVNLFTICNCILGNTAEMGYVYLAFDYIFYFFLRGFLFHHEKSFALKGYIPTTFSNIFF